MHIAGDIHIVALFSVMGRNSFTISFNALAWRK